MIEKLSEMFELQERLNRRINENWRQLRTEEDFARATWIECAELVDSLPWKWWKKQEPDMENVQIEVVDIWHFIMSYILLKNPLPQALESEAVKLFMKGVNEDFTHLNIDGAKINHYLGETDRYKKIVYLTERVAESFLKQDLEEGSFFFGLLVKNTISMERLYLLYIGKNILNHIRQEKGYNEGSYKKTINGIEDNRYLLQIVNQVSDKNQLEKKLKELFNHIHQ
ncbi:MAG: dUTPase [Aquificae bacterium]|nr:dUTPase [Aquificota bacterium]